MRPVPDTRPSNLPPGGPEPPHYRCGWIQPEPDVLGRFDGTEAFVANAGFFHAIHPAWYFINSSGRVQSHGNVNDPRVVTAATLSGTLLWPLILGEAPQVLPKVQSQNRAAHVAELCQIVVGNNYAGLDLDYEGLPDSDRTNFTALCTELSRALHGLTPPRRLSAAVRMVVHPLKNSSVYDYASLVQVLDAVHIMGYDLHTANSEPGSNCPLWVLESVLQTVAAAGAPGKFICGLPNYGRVFSLDPQPRTIDLRGAPAECDSGVFTYTDAHDPNCSFRQSWGLLQGQSGFQPNGIKTQGKASGQVYFDDLISLGQRAQVFKQAGLGVTYWPLGREVDNFLECLRIFFP